MMFFGLDTVNMYYDAVCQGLGLGALGPDYGKDIVVTSDGGVALVGERNMGTGYSSVFFVKLMEDCIGTGSTLHDSIFVTTVEEQHLATDKFTPIPPAEDSLSIGKPRTKGSNLQHVWSPAGGTLKSDSKRNSNEPSYWNVYIML